MSPASLEAYHRTKKVSSPKINETINNCEVESVKRHSSEHNMAERLSEQNRKCYSQKSAFYKFDQRPNHRRFEASPEKTAKKANHSQKFREENIFESDLESTGSRRYSMGPELNYTNKYNENNVYNSKYLNQHHTIKCLPKFDLRYHLNKNYYQKISPSHNNLNSSLESKQVTGVKNSKFSSQAIDSLNNSFESNTTSTTTTTPHNSSKSLSLLTTTSTSSISSNTSNLSNYSTSSSSSLIETTSSAELSKKKINSSEKVKKRHLTSLTSSRDDIKRLKD
jgi:hypothetical protein